MDGARGSGTGRTISIGFFSRRGRVNRESSFSVLG
jgi:hypothetical protein